MRTPSLSGTGWVHEDCHDNRPCLLKEMTEYNVTCLEGGVWQEPVEWPVCYTSKYLFNIKGEQQKNKAA